MSLPLLSSLSGGQARELRQVALLEGNFPFVKRWWCVWQVCVVWLIGRKRVHGKKHGREEKEAGNRIGNAQRPKMWVVPPCLFPQFLTER